MEQELHEGTRVVLSNLDPKAAKADGKYADMAGLHGEVEDYGYIQDFGAFYYTVRYDNGEMAVSQRHELTIEAYHEKSASARRKARPQIRLCQTELAALRMYLEDAGRPALAQRITEIKLELEDMWPQV